MAKLAQRETYNKDHINSIRSFIPLELLHHTPAPLSPGLKDFFSKHNGMDLPDDIAVLKYYVDALRLINMQGLHIQIPMMLNRLLELSQESRSINFASPSVQDYLRNEDTP